jgi:hypothetical protein
MVSTYYSFGRRYEYMSFFSNLTHLQGFDKISSWMSVLLKVRPLRCLETLVSYILMTRLHITEEWNRPKSQWR